MITFFIEEIDFNLKNKTFYKKWIVETAQRHNLRAGDISIIFCSDKYIHEVNKKFLEHDYPTDIITFNYNTEDKISGDLFISVETVAANAELYSPDFSLELSRVIIHGILHLIGFDDLTEEEIKIMRAKEDEQLEYFSKFFEE